MESAESIRSAFESALEGARAVADGLDARAKAALAAGAGVAVLLALRRLRQQSVRTRGGGRGGGGGGGGGRGGKVVAVVEEPAQVAQVVEVVSRDKEERKEEERNEEEEEGPVRARAEGDLAVRSSTATQPALSYLDVFLEAMSDQWTEKNAQGYIILLIAENKLTTGMVVKRLRQVKNVPDSVLGYTSFRGDPLFRAAIAKYVQQTFASDAGAIDPECLAVSAGCGAVIDNVCFAVCDRGSEVLIPAPYYPAFDNDLRVRSGVEPVPVFSSSGSAGLPTNEDLDKAFSSCSNPRVLLLTNPHNPLGTVLNAQQVHRCIKWALMRGLHVISDEIYANSVHAPEGSREVFRSAMAMAPDLAEKLGEELVAQRLHTIFGFSKDFCASGLRVGCIHTKNRRLLMAMDNVGYFCGAFSRPSPAGFPVPLQTPDATLFLALLVFFSLSLFLCCVHVHTGVSGHTAHLMTQALEDASFVRRFLQKNQRNLRSSYNVLESKLKAAGIPFLPASAGMFCWIDMRKFLRER